MKSVPLPAQVLVHWWVVFYAAGKLDRLQSWLCALERRDVLRLLDLSFTGGGIFKGDKLMDALSALVKDQTIEDLPIDFTAVAVDLDRQKEIWFTDGSLFEAIRGFHCHSLRL